MKNNKNYTNLMTNDVTQINPTPVKAIFSPQSEEELKEIILMTQGDISIAGGQYSMGGQTTSKGTYQLDLRAFNNIIDLNTEDKTITVQSGVRWNDIQNHIDKHDLSVSIMQTYSNFTVGGSISVNVHGRYMGLGPIALSILSLRVMLLDGKILKCSLEENKDVFNGVIGGFGAFAIILDATLQLTDNTKVEQFNKKVKTSEYKQYFDENIRNNDKIVFHNGDLYPPHYNYVNAVSWQETNKIATQPRFQSLKKYYPLEKYLLWAIADTPFGKWRREYIYDPIIYMKERVHYRNFEANYDVAELEPVSRETSTYVLQEYFIPVNQFDKFVTLMASVFQKYNANIINVSIRHAKEDNNTIMSWARGETFAFVVYYKQGVDEASKKEVGLWTRELINTVLSCNGTYYLPYQPHATYEQFMRAYPNAKKLFALKKQYDPEFRIKNSLWNKYYNEFLGNKTETKDGTLKTLMAQEKYQTKLYDFLENVFKLYPTKDIYSIVIDAINKYDDEKEMYEYMLKELKNIKTFTNDIVYGIPTLRKQKTVITEQTLKLLKSKNIRYFVESGSKGMYASKIKEHIFIENISFENSEDQTYSLPDILERGQISKFGDFNYVDNLNGTHKPTISSTIIDVFTYFGGLHHMNEEALEIQLEKIKEKVKEGGQFILREHDVTDKEISMFVSLIHTVFNAGTGETYEVEKAELRNFRTVNEWIELLAKYNFEFDGKKLYQDGDPSDNVLMSFTKKPQRFASEKHIM